MRILDEIDIKAEEKFKEEKTPKNLKESLFLSKEEITNKIKELRDEFPESFEGATEEDISNTLKDVVIDYLDGCTYLTFDNDGKDNIIDITGNSMNILSKPEYKALMSKVFEGVIDDWLTKHNLTHGNICSFRFDPDTCQMFVEFDANEVDFDELQDYFKYEKEEDEEVGEIEEDLEGTCIELEEEVEEEIRARLTDLERKLLNKLNINNIYPEDAFFMYVGDSNTKYPLELQIQIDGDWKHDHIFTQHLVDAFCKENNLDIDYKGEETLKEDGDDSYESLHIWGLKFNDDNDNIEKAPNFNDIENDLNETYSDEELDDVVGKTYNQHKVLNVYRRNKYGDSRLYAHTRCNNCGREKRVFLSNLLNDPDKYGSCVCSNTNVESRLDNIEDLFDGSKKLSTNTSGYTGVTKLKKESSSDEDKWRAYIEIDGKRTYLGDFHSKSAAIRARKEAAEKGIKWYKNHKDDFMKNYRRKTKRYRSLRKKKSKKN